MEAHCYRSSGARAAFLTLILVTSIPHTSGNMEAWDFRGAYEWTEGLSNETGWGLAELEGTPGPTWVGYNARQQRLERYDAAGKIVATQLQAASVEDPRELQCTRAILAEDGLHYLYAALAPTLPWYFKPWHLIHIFPDGSRAVHELNMPDRCLFDARVGLDGLEILAIQVAGYERALLHWSESIGIWTPVAGDFAAATSVRWHDAMLYYAATVGMEADQSTLYRVPWQQDTALGLPENITTMSGEIRAIRANGAWLAFQLTRTSCEAEQPNGIWYRRDASAGFEHVLDPCTSLLGGTIDAVERLQVLDAANATWFVTGDWYSPPPYASRMTRIPQWRHVDQWFMSSWYDPPYHRMDPGYLFEWNGTVYFITNHHPGIYLDPSTTVWPSKLLVHAWTGICYGGYGNPCGPDVENDLSKETPNIGIGWMVLLVALIARRAAKRKRTSAQRQGLGGLRRARINQVQDRG